MDGFKQLFRRDPSGRMTVDPGAGFPSEQSTRHWLRPNGQQAVEAGALILHLGTWHYSPERLHAFQVELGKRLALEKLRRAKDHTSFEQGSV